MVVEIIQTLFRYNTWATLRVLETAASVSKEQLLATVGASFPSIRDTLVHAMRSQRGWLARWKDLPLPPAFEFTDFNDIHSIRERWSGIDAETQSFIAELDDSSLMRIVKFSNPRGESKAFPLWQLMLNQINHQTQHRSEAAAMLTGFGCSPGPLDFYYFLDQVAH